MTDKEILEQVYIRLASLLTTRIKKKKVDEAGRNRKYNSNWSHRRKTVRKVVQFIEREWLIQQQQKVAQQNPLKINKP